MTQGRYKTPGVYRQDVFERAPAELRTGVPLFLGLASQQPESEAQKLTLWPQFIEQFGAPLADGYLGAAVQGFFANGGNLCYVVRLDDPSVSTLRTMLSRIEALDTIDLVCAPDIMRPSQPGVALEEATIQALQASVLDHCARTGDRFAILDSWPAAAVDDVLRQRQALQGDNGALYYPWIGVQDNVGAALRMVPPCGHVAGVYNRVDRASGVFKAPANEVLEGVISLGLRLSNADQERLNPEGIDCIRSFPGRGIRVWGARTLSDAPAWTYIGARRLFLTVGRWVQRNMADTAFEPNDPKLWARIMRELNVYFSRLFERGALRGATPQEAFYVKCDAETNPPDARERGEVVTEIGLAPGLPNEFVVVRIIHRSGGVTIA